MASRAHNEAVKRYDAENAVQIRMKLNKKTDADILEWLARQENRQGMLKMLIRKEIARDKAIEDDARISATLRRILADDEGRQA